jgi:hypothetical protein
MKPYEHQEKSIAHLLRILPKQIGVVDASDCGTGKTRTAVGVMQEMDLPTLVVCPKAVIPSWHRTALGENTDLDAINYEMVRTGRTPYGSFYVPRGCRKPRFLWNRAVRMLIFDEAHRCQASDSINSELMRAAARQEIPTLALSATLAQSPLEMDALGFLLRLHDSNSPATLSNPDPLDFFRWSRRYGCGPGLFSRHEFHGTEQQKLKQMEKLHRIIFPDKGVRVRIRDLPWFPEISITAELYDMGNEERINALYAEMAAEVTALHARDAEMKAERLRKAKENGYTGDFLPDEPLEEQLRARQEIELIKVPVFVELARDAVANGMSVALFVNFQQTIQALRQKLKTDCVIDGSQIGPRGAIARETNRLRFQEDTERIILCQSDAGGLGLDLQDLRGFHPRVELISPGFNAKLLRQIFYRVCRAGAKSKSLARLLFAAGTDEEPIQKAVAKKLNCLDSLNDGDLQPANLRFT